MANRLGVLVLHKTEELVVARRLNFTNVIVLRLPKRFVPLCSTKQVVLDAKVGVGVQVEVEEEVSSELTDGKER